MDQVLLLHVEGPDRPGICARLTAVMADHGLQVLDMSQAVIHRTLLLGMMVRLPPERPDSGAVLSPLLAAAHDLGLRARVHPISDDEYETWVNRQGLERNILTLMAPRLMAEQVAAVSRAVSEAGLNIDVITRLTGRPSLRGGGERAKRAVVEMSLRGTPASGDTVELRAELVRIGREMRFDLAWQADDAYRRSRRMVAFDMDRVLIRQETIHELAIEAGVPVQDGELAGAIWNGDLSVEEGVRRRVELLEGLPVEALDRVAARLELNDGAERLARHLKHLGYKLALISGGFHRFADRLHDELGLDYVKANKLEIAGGALTGRVTGPIVTGQRKADMLKGIARIERISMQQVIAVGDGPNDLPMLAAAGLGIAFHAPPSVQDSAPQGLTTFGLDGILYMLGLRDRDLLPAGDRRVSA